MDQEDRLPRKNPICSQKTCKRKTRKPKRAWKKLGQIKQLLKIANTKLASKVKANQKELTTVNVWLTVNTRRYPLFPLNRSLSTVQQTGNLSGTLSHHQSEQVIELFSPKLLFNVFFLLNSNPTSPNKIEFGAYTPAVQKARHRPVWCGGGTQARPN